jgi:IS30 family transposase
LTGKSKGEEVMGYRRLALKDRYQIEAYLQSGFSLREIAKILNFSPSTLSREIRKAKHYNAEFAQRIAKRRGLSRYATRLKIKGKLKKVICSELLKDWSPEQITGRMKLKGKVCVSHQTIYRFIAREKLSGGNLFKHLRILRKEGKDRSKIKWRPHPEVLKGRRFIKERPQIVETRKRFGDLERDTVFGKANGTLLLTIVDRKSRLLRLKWLKKKCSKLVHKATISALRGEQIKTITNDNGTEFAQHHKTAKTLNAKIYFSHAYRSWERGTNENINGLLRQYYPRKKAIGYPTKREVRMIERRINTRPRKGLGYLTPLEVHKST